MRDNHGVQAWMQTRVNREGRARRQRERKEKVYVWGEDLGSWAPDGPTRSSHAGNQGAVSGRLLLLPPPFPRSCTLPWRSLMQAECGLRTNSGPPVQHSRQV